MRNARISAATRTGGLAFALLAASLAAPEAEAGWAQSSNTYTYTSGNYGLIFDGENLKGEYTNSQFQTWSMTFGAPLATNLGFDPNNPTDIGANSWTFDDGRADGNGTFDSTTGWQFISVGTDGSGAITDWLAGFVGPESPGSTALGFSCGGLGCAFFQTLVPESQGVSELGYSFLLSEAAVSDDASPSSWDEQFALADGTSLIGLAAVYYGFSYLTGTGFIPPEIYPELDAAFYGLGGSVPEPGALALVCAGLIGTMAARRRAQRQA